ncbi:unnamed protein product [Parascedosporium putredinis]|uniref:UDP-glucose:glycoprotein glucosyltransferase n=1 Tax=Parascedosporium putredinis TaxID=1442378 RepID=A0A9P1GZV4_9PEZI|nr:unnamed protein product [Parascedosporium putredinis]CAI7992093.1 unnamed protein product [Parascedosporium putredinis]
MELEIVPTVTRGIPQSGAGVLVGSEIFATVAVFAGLSRWAVFHHAIPLGPVVWVMVTPRVSGQHLLYLAVMGHVSGGGNIPIHFHDEMQKGQTTAFAIAEPPVSPKLGDFNLIYSFLGCRGGRSLGGFVHHDSASPHFYSPQRPDTTTKLNIDEFIRVNDGGTTNCIGGAPGGNDMAPTHAEPGLSTALAELEDFKGDRILRVQAEPSPERPLILGDLPIANSPNHLFWKLERERRIDKRIINRLYPDLELTTHVFIDMSNIYIGFNDTFKFLRGIPDCDRTPLPPINFDALSRVLERDRMIGARELVGSAADPDNLTDLPNYFGDARKLGYKTSILRRAERILSVAGYFADAATEKELYERFLALLREHDYLSDPESLSTFKLGLSMRSAAPRIEAHYQYYATSVELEHPDDDTPAIPGSPFTLPSLPFDRTLGWSGPSAILYTDLTSPTFPALHRSLAERALRGDLIYSVRYRRERHLRKENSPLPISGYGVELALKKTDYIVIDDREATGSEGSGLHSKYGAEAQLVLGDEEAVSDLKPCPKPSPPGVNILWMNGAQLIERQVEPFTLLDLLRRERRLIAEAKSAGLTGSESIALLGHPNVTSAKVDGGLPRFDWTDNLEGGKVIIWLNDLESDAQYEEFPSALTALLQRTYPGQVPRILREGLQLGEIDEDALVQQIFLKEALEVRNLRIFADEEKELQLIDLGKLYREHASLLGKAPVAGAHASSAKEDWVAITVIADLSSEDGLALLLSAAQFKTGNPGARLEIALLNAYLASVSFEPGSNGLLLNGRVIGPLSKNEVLGQTELQQVLDLERKAHLPEGIFESAPPLRTSIFNSWESKHTTIEVGNAGSASVHIVGLLNPASEQGQRWAPILKVLSEVDGVYIKLFLNPDEKLEELPVKRFYRYVLESGPTFDETGTVKPSGACFKGVPSDALLTLGMDVPPAWLVAAKSSVHDPDNIKLSLVKGDVDAVYELRNILIEGHSRMTTKNAAPPSGAQLVLGTEKNPHSADTIIMANLGYFQFKANPGIYNIRLQNGRSSEIFEIESVGAYGYEASPGDEGTSIALMDFKGTTLYPRLQRKGSAFDEQAEINIFSVASGHLYERMLNIMMLSVMKHTDHTVKFWFIEQFLSPSFKDSIPHLAQEYGFRYEMVTYKWPHWLRQQREKQREIWGYKILFLDVLFPLSLDKVIFVDADQIVRADMMDLVNLDLGGAPYGFTPMCDSRTEMEGFRFWKQGYWANYLRGLPYHISALYVVDLRRFRELAAGDRLRQQYHTLSADPNSLANLDQDLPNHMQFMIPIHSLPRSGFGVRRGAVTRASETRKRLTFATTQ